MPKRLVILLVVCSSSLAFADAEREVQWSSVATTQLRQRLQSEWMAIVEAETSVGWTVALPNGKTFSGDWAIRIGGWSYLFEYTKVRCRVQLGETSYVTCNDADSVDSKQARIVIDTRKRSRGIAALAILHGGVFGKSFAITKDAQGAARTTLETIVSSPMAETRTSRRYRADVTLTTTGFSVGEPVLVEQYLETCYATHGCHDTYWNCQRSR